MHVAIGFVFDSQWLKSWRESFKPITKRSNRNHVITFDSNLKTALYILLDETMQILVLSYTVLRTVPTN